jgi:hypothetical protein
VANLAAAEALAARDPAAAAGCGGAAGLSLGEYAALVWAGAMSFEDAIKARCAVAGAPHCGGAECQTGAPARRRVASPPSLPPSHTKRPLSRRPPARLRRPKHPPAPRPPWPPAAHPQVVKVRAEAMAAAAASPPGGRPHGMLSVVGLPDAELAAACEEAAGKLGPGTVCEIANYLFPTVGHGFDCLSNDT